MKEILITGGLGYIGSHTAVEFIEAGYNVVIIDDLSNTNRNVLDHIEAITGIKPIFYPYDLKDKALTSNVFKKHSFDAVVHFAAYKAVGESIQHPELYYENNLLSLLNVLSLLKESSVKHFVFSSSATVYGIPDVLPVTEQTELKPATNPYGHTKMMGEQMIRDACVANDTFHSVILRYFNPVGAHQSALIGELPQGVPNNLMPYVTQTAAGIREQLTIFGNDYNTPDGTCIRDYIHVVDLAKAHLAAYERMQKKAMKTAVEVYNVGTGRGFSVLEMVELFEKENKIAVNYQIGHRRDGDVPAIYADVTKANKQLEWQAVHGLKEMVTSAWDFQKQLTE